MMRTIFCNSGKFLKVVPSLMAPALLICICYYVYIHSNIRNLQRRSDKTPTQEDENYFRIEAIISETINKNRKKDLIKSPVSHFQGNPKFVRPVDGNEGNRVEKIDELEYSFPDPNSESLKFTSEDKIILQRFINRHKSFKNACQKSPSKLNRPKNIWELPSHLLTLKRSNFATCLPMKTGSSSMFRFIWDVEHFTKELDITENRPIIDGVKPDEANYGSLFYRLVSKRPKFTSNIEMEELLFTKSHISKHFVKAITVRHPLVRFYSSWNDHMSIRNGAPIGEQYKYFGILPNGADGKSWDGDHSMTWPAFVSRILEASSTGSNIKIDGHHKPISDLCLDCLIDYNYVIKQETMNEDVDFISRNILNTEVKLKKLYSFNDKSSDELLSVYCQFNDRVIGEIENYFVRDFMLFDYDRFDRSKSC